MSSYELCVVRRKDNGNFYALKVIVKEGMTDTELKALVNERETFVRVNHPFVAKLHFAFQTVSSFSFILRIWGFLLIFFL